jgi:hypothetical protein
MESEGLLVEMTPVAYVMYAMDVRVNVNADGFNLPIFIKH